jgi:hypothetical protein
MGVRNWKRAAQEREEWRRLILEAKARYRAVVPEKKKKKKKKNDIHGGEDFKL